MDVTSQGMYQDSMPTVFARLMASSRAQGRRLPEAVVEPAPIKVPERSEPGRKVEQVAASGSASARYDEAEMQRVQREVAELKRQEQKLRAHELAHLTHAGPYARGGMQFSYERGPDGALYATSGEVSIDTSPVPNDPEATLRKAQVIQRAAMAPAEPSPQDHAVAAKAAQMAAQARVDMMRERAEEQGGEAGTPLINSVYAAVGVGQAEAGSGALNLYA